jgi:hypothetical protein
VAEPAVPPPSRRRAGLVIAGAVAVAAALAGLLFLFLRGD